MTTSVDFDELQHLVNLPSSPCHFRGSSANVNEPGVVDVPAFGSTLASLS